MPMTLPVEIRCDGYPLLTVSTGDISHGGAFLQCEVDEFPPVGTEIVMKAIKPMGDGEDPPLVKARIVRATADGVGVQFLG